MPWSRGPALRDGVPRSARQRVAARRRARHRTACRADAPPPLPGEPGPFAWADADIAAKVLDAAGFATVRVEACDPVVRPTGPADEVAELLIELGPAGGAYRAASADAQAAARAGVLALLQRFRDDAGDLALPCGVWLITASRPALS